MENGEKSKENTDFGHILHVLGENGADIVELVVEVVMFCLAAT